jgi:hypothetical protein
MSDINVFVSALITILVSLIVFRTNKNNQDLASTISKIAPYIVTAIIPFALSIIDKVAELSLVKTFYNNFFGVNAYIDLQVFSISLIAAIYIILMALVWIIRKIISRSKPFETNINKSLKKELQSPEYRDFIKKCKHNLDMIDESTGWKNNSGKYVKLNVDVNILINGKEKNGKKELINAILNGRYKDNIIKIIGDPGSGKSVSLRELYRQILNKTAKNGRIPVYINMNSWVKTWKGEIPTQEDFERYIKETMLASCSINSKKFVNENFNKITINHGWFFILDSFDEIPFLTSSTQNSELVNAVSLILYNFLDEVGGGIVASRPNLTPSSSFSAKTILEINAFDDIKIFQYLKRSMKLNNKELKDVFTQMPHILEAMKNPFYCSLIDGYYSTKGVFPHNLNELFDYTIKQRFENSNFSEKDLTTFCVYAADYMISSEQYLSEIPKKVLLDGIKKSRMNKNAKDILPQLIKMNILRNAKNGESVLFVHRRFQEYFYIKKVIEDNDSIESLSNTFLENCTDLDIAYLLVEIAPEETAKIFISKCCDTICDPKINYNASVLPETQRALNALYFLNIYCQNHKGSMLEERERVEEFVYSLIISPFTPVQVEILDMLFDFNDYNIHSLYLSNLKDVVTLKYLAYSLSLYNNYKNKIFTLLIGFKKKYLVKILNRGFYFGFDNKVTYSHALYNLKNENWWTKLKKMEYYWFILGIENRVYRLWLPFNLLVTFAPYLGWFLWYFLDTLHHDRIMNALKYVGFNETQNAFSYVAAILLFISFEFLTVFISLSNIEAKTILGLKNIKRRKILKFKIKSTTILSVLVCMIYIPIIVLSIVCIVYMVKYWFIVFIILIGIIYFIFLGMKHLYFYLSSKAKVRKTIATFNFYDINRTFLNKSLDKSLTNSDKIVILNYIKKHHIKFIGKWNEENERPLYGNERVDELLAELDMRDFNPHSRL